MTKLLIQGNVILAKGPFVEDDATVSAADIVFPKQSIPDGEIVEADVPGDFVCSEHEWDHGVVAPRVISQILTEAMVAKNNAAIMAQLTDLDMKSIRALREGDIKRLKDLDSKAISLRTQLK